MEDQVVVNAALSEYLTWVELSLQVTCEVCHSTRCVLMEEGLRTREVRPQSPGANSFLEELLCSTLILSTLSPVGRGDDFSSRVPCVGHGRDTHVTKRIVWRRV